MVSWSWSGFKHNSKNYTRLSAWCPSDKSFGLQTQNINKQQINITYTERVPGLSGPCRWCVVQPSVPLWRGDAWTADLCGRTGQTLTGLQAGQRLVASDWGQGATQTSERWSFLFTWKTWHKGSTLMSVVDCSAQDEMYLGGASVCQLVWPPDSVCVTAPGKSVRGLCLQTAAPDSGNSYC